MGATHLAYLEHDSYYNDHSHLTPDQRAAVNYDHPDSLDTRLLVQHLHALSAGQAVAVPTYDFATHTRTPITHNVQPAPVILIEGILIFVEKPLYALMDMRIFVDTDADLRFIRRLHRDMQERGRTLESVVTQYLTTVRPMHIEFVEPSKRNAHVIIPEGGDNRVALAMIVSHIRKVLELGF